MGRKIEGMERILKDNLFVAWRHLIELGIEEMFYFYEVTGKYTNIKLFMLIKKPKSTSLILTLHYS